MTTQTTSAESGPGAASRDARVRTLIEATSIPTAAGREGRVADFIARWVQARPALRLWADEAGNLIVEPAQRWTTPRGGDAAGPVLITAHLDHPAFVVERIVSPSTVELTFRGGVMDDYFANARIVVHTASDRRLGATVIECNIDGGPAAASAGFKTCLAELDDALGEDDASLPLAAGDVATWDLPPAEIDAEGVLHSAACDDLAAVAAALCAMEELAARAASGDMPHDTRLLFTRAEEIGFVGAIAACKLGTIPAGAAVVALENSRAFPDSPIGGGPIVRVGDRLSVFSPRLTNAIAKRAEEITGRAASPTASQKNAEMKGTPWQRKLMAGGACEATVFCAFGHNATCLCLPLGNYHNMADLAAVQDGSYDRQKNGPPRVGREFIAVSDFHGLVDLLAAIGMDLPGSDPIVPRLEKLYEDRSFVLRE